jgi:hypothetical protein
MFATTGNFGLSEFPFIFAVITRVCESEIKELLHGKMLMYVDDMMGVCHRKSLTHDMAVTRDYCIKLLGPDSVADDKSASGRRLDIIGWCIDLDKIRVTIARKNLLKLIHTLFSIDFNGRIRQKTVQKIGLLFSRYGEICRHLKPFLPDVHAELACFADNPHAPRHLRDAAKDCINLWRMYAISLYLHEDKYSRSITSYLSKTVDYTFEFDASLTGLGIIIRGPQSDLFAVAQVSIGNFRLHRDSSYQNSVEFLASTVALAVLASRGVRGCGIALKGDNTSSLSWALRQRFKT